MDIYIYISIDFKLLLVESFHIFLSTFENKDKINKRNQAAFISPLGSLRIPGALVHLKVFLVAQGH